jgi:hypothetical protein
MKQIVAPAQEYLKLSDVDAAYIAGFVDGEGSIGLWKETRKDNRIGWRYKPVLTAANTDIPVLEWIRSVTGVGSIVEHCWVNPVATTGGRRTCYVWRCSPQPTKHVLGQILPFLRLKPRQAELVLEFQSVMFAGKHMDIADYEKAEEIYHELRRLNRRGTVPYVEPKWSISIRKTKMEENATRMCSRPGCDRPHKAKGFCAMHYKQFSQGRLVGTPGA